MNRRKADQIIARDSVATGAQVNAYLGMTFVFGVFKVRHVVDWSWSAVLTPLTIAAIYWLLMLVVTTLRAYQEERRP